MQSEDFCWDHMTDVLLETTYTSAVSREIVRIPLAMATLSDMSIKTDGIMNSYIKESCGEKVYTILGPEFGLDEGKMAIIV